MKRFMGLAAAVAVFASAAPAAAQDMPMRFGVIGGVNFSNVSGDFVEDSEMRTGFDVGVLAQVPLGMVLTFQPEIHYSQKGFEAEQTVLGTVFEVETTLTYLDIPLLLRMGMPLAEGLDVDLLVGPYIGVGLSCEGSVDGEDAEDCDEDPATDFGVMAGAGFSWAMGAGDLMIDGRYQWGFSEIFEEVDMKNRNIQVLVGYAFPFGM